MSVPYGLRYVPLACSIPASQMPWSMVCHGCSRASTSLIWSMKAPTSSERSTGQPKWITTLSMQPIIAFRAPSTPANVDAGERRLRVRSDFIHG